jgi:hypothetical protein
MMKKTVLASLLMVFSLGAIAEQGGFEGGKTPPPQKQQDAGYKGLKTPARRISNRFGIFVRAAMSRWKVISLKS